MGYHLFSREWVNQVTEEMKNGPSPERKSAIDSNYWTWIDECKQKMDIRLSLVLKGGENQEDRYAYFNLKQGEVVNGYLGTAEERGSADFVLAGQYDDWYEIIEGPRELTQNMMYRKIRLLQGNLHSFYRGIYFFVELLRSGIRVPTIFENTKEQSIQ